jgi:hypothetical protein
VASAVSVIAPPRTLSGRRHHAGCVRAQTGVRSMTSLTTEPSRHGTVGRTG